MKPLAALRRITDERVIRLSEELDRVHDAFNRRERYQNERDKKLGVLHIELNDALDDTNYDGTQNIPDYTVRLIFWDTLGELDYETALYVVLRYCLGYSMTEIAAGMNVTYSRVKYLISKTIKRSR